MTKEGRDLLYEKVEGFIESPYGRTTPGLQLALCALLDLNGRLNDMETPVRFGPNLVTERLDAYLAKALPNLPSREQDENDKE